MRNYVSVNMKIESIPNLKTTFDLPVSKVNVTP